MRRDNNNNMLWWGVSLSYVPFYCDNIIESSTLNLSIALLSLRFGKPRICVSPWTWIVFMCLFLWGSLNLAFLVSRLSRAFCSTFLWGLLNLAFLFSALLCMFGSLFLWGSLNPWFLVFYISRISICAPHSLSLRFAEPRISYLLSHFSHVYLFSARLSWGLANITSSHHSLCYSMADEDPDCIRQCHPVHNTFWITSNCSLLQVLCPVGSEMGAIDVRFLCTWIHVPCYTVPMPERFPPFWGLVSVTKGFSFPVKFPCDEEGFVPSHLFIFFQRDNICSPFLCRGPFNFYWNDIETTTLNIWQWLRICIFLQMLYCCTTSLSLLAPFVGCDEGTLFSFCHFLGTWDV